MSRIVRFHSLGDAEVLKIEDTAPAEPGPGEVRIRVQALGLNRAEALFRQGKYLETPRLPSRIGYEASGHVDKLGAGVENFKVGDYVATIPSFSQTQYGVYGDEAIVPARSLTRMPAHVSPAEAAAAWMQYLTAYGALVELGNLKKGQFVVVTAASSSVGLAAIQLIKDIGAISIATTRTQHKVEALLAAGADHVIVTGEENVAARILEITEKVGADFVFDSVAGPLVSELAKGCKLEAQIFIYGALSMETTAFPFRPALKKGLIVRGYTMFLITDDEERFERSKRYILERLENGVFKPVIAKVFTLDQIAESHKYLESNQQFGKIVVEVK
ncbi:MAG: zinc-dependent alcohol dehydrogenase family protein [Candidatus Melainabacteria bacterium]|nr:zinc-dependent alcohol dehydrogenase family protein [Candidatus Melainabacteria bacterium]